MADQAAAGQQQPPAYMLVAADELGVLKVIQVPAGPKWDAAAVVAQWGSADKANAVHSLACSAATCEPGVPALLAVGRKGGRIDILDAATGAQHSSFTAAAPAGKKNPDAKTAVIALHFRAEEDRPLQLVAGTSDGMVSVCSTSGDAAQEAGCSGGSWGVQRSFSVGANMACMAVDSAGSHIVVGGEGMQPSIWDLSTGSRVWQGKGGKPNRIGLVDKPFTTAVAFLPNITEGAGDSSSPASAAAGPSGRGEDVAAVSRRFVAGSAAAKLQLYDTAAGRRPQQEVVFGEARVTAISVEPDGQRVWSANGTGHMQLLVLKTNKLMDALKGAGGSVRSLALYPGLEPLVASVGLDRFLRIHDCSTRTGRARVYLKQQLTSVAWLPTVQPQQQQPVQSMGEGAEEQAAEEVAEVPAPRRNKGTKSRKHRGEASTNGTGAAKPSKKQRQQGM